MTSIMLKAGWRKGSNGISSAHEDAMVSAGTGGVASGLAKLWDCLITQIGITRPERAASLIGHILTLEMKLTE